MRIAVPREIKDNEFRVALTPAGADELIRAGHEVAVESGAGVGARFGDDDYAAVGARVLPDAEATWDFGSMILKVKEPQTVEFPLLREDHLLFTYLHLAAEPAVTQALIDSGATAVAYETVQSADGSLPLLYPMSEVAGCLSTQVGAFYLTRPQGGRGVLMGAIGGVPNANVVIIGAGVAGMNAANIALGLGADVTLLDTNVNKLRTAYWRWNGGVRQLKSDPLTLEQQVLQADLVIGSVLIPGARAPKLVTHDMVENMKPGSVLVDVAIDQGGCFQDSRPTSHSDPIYTVAESTFYCVTNMPGAVPYTSTLALTNATQSYILAMAGRGYKEAMRRDANLATGLNVHGGRVTNAAVAAALGLNSVPVAEVLAD